MELMKCGHTAMAEDSKGSPCCAICYGDKGAEQVEENLPNLTGRFAVCSYGDQIVPSSYDLPFFHYNGSNKDVPKELISQFWALLKKGWKMGYSGRHNPNDTHTFPKELDDEIEKARQAIKDARKYDEYYCGCKGWD